MTAPEQDVARIAAGLTNAQREYIAEGPYPHWTQTRVALEKRGLSTGTRIGPMTWRFHLSELGLAVRHHLQKEPRT